MRNIFLSMNNLNRQNRLYNMKKYFFCLIIALLSTTTIQAADEFLDVDTAFQLSVTFENPQLAVVKWEIADNYYLYRNKLNFSIKNAAATLLGQPQIPAGKIKKDLFFGDVEIYHQQLIVKLPIDHTADLSKATLEIGYQGCADAGFCYPPTYKEINLLTATQSTFLSEQDRIALLFNNQLWLILLTFFGFGLLLSLTPCVFPMIPILSSIIIGQGKQINTRKAFIISAIYVFAMSLTYATVGALTGVIGENLQASLQNPWVLLSFAAIFVALAFSMFGFYELQMPQAIQTKLVNVSNQQQSGTLIGVAIMGFLSALVVGPCVAAPLAGVLIYISQTKDALLGFFALFFMGLGMGALLLVVGTSAGKFVPQAGAWMNQVKYFFGILLLAMAIWMLDERLISASFKMLLWAALLIISAVYMGVLQYLPQKATNWHKLLKSLSIIMLVYGTLLIWGIAKGNQDIFHPLAEQQEELFKQIKGISGLQTELAAAQGQWVMVDFYADWCTSCKEMEYFTFSDPQVRAALKNVLLLQADVTANDVQDRELQKQFNLYGPPVLLFFNPTGEEELSYRVVGFISAEKLLLHLQKLIR